jgi:aminoglycoside 3-N-acetyltransferase
MSAPPWQRSTLADHLARLGVEHGVDILVHASLRAVGWIEGGPATVLGALRDVLGPSATVVVPVQTTEYSTTSSAHRAKTAGLGPAGRAGYRRELAPFTASRTPSSGMGILAEHVRTSPGAARSAHPITSFAALGPAAGELCAIHPRTCHLGEESPLGALNRRAAQVLLLGVGFEKATAFHLAEYRIAPRRRVYYSKLPSAHRPSGVWAPFEGIVLDDSDFGAVGESMRGEEWVRSHDVGSARSVRFPMPQAVDFAHRWMLEHREGSGSGL